MSAPKPKFNGKLEAQIQGFGSFNGVANVFRTDGQMVAFQANHRVNSTDYNFIIFEFPYSIESRRYEFIKGSVIKPPEFFQFFFDKETNSPIYRPHRSRNDAGYVVINFNKDSGTLKANFHFTFIENPTGIERNVVGELEATGLEHFKG